MKALFRNPGETILSTTSIDGIDWTTGAPLTNPAWCGGAYALCEDCPVTDPEPADFDISTIEVPDTNAPAEEDGTAEVPTTTRRVAVFNTARYEARKAQDGAEDAPAPGTPAEGADGAEEPPDTIIIDGVEYTRAGSE